MALSTSSSEAAAISSSEVAAPDAEAPDPELTATAHLLPSGLRLTAADRPGMAQPVPERDVPAQPWRAISAAVLVLLVLLTAGWEWRMRSLGLVAGDLSSSFDTWADLRRSVDRQDTPLLLIGDSRILFDTDLARVRELTGVRAVQLGIPGGTGLPVLEDIANDPHFHGLAIVGMAETSYFDTLRTPYRTHQAMELAKTESPSKRASYQVQRVLSRGLAMLDDSYQLSTLVTHLDPDWRAGVKGPRHSVWKNEVQTDDGQAYLWQRIEEDPRLRQHAVDVWFELFPPFPQDDKSIHAILVRSKDAVDRIRARGGDVVFLRPPSSPKLGAVEARHLPRARAWEPLLVYTQAAGVHADDLPAAQHLSLPEASHLSRGCATVFTDAYIRAVAQHTTLLKLRPDAPAPLSTADCVKPS